MRPDPAFTRRALLVGCVLLAAGCRDHPARPVRPQPDPDAAALAEARDGELLLIASYDAALSRSNRRSRPALLAAKATHEVHLSALRTVAPGGTPGAAAAADLRRTLRDSARTLRRAAVEAGRGSTAALLASIAASHRAAAG